MREEPAPQKPAHAFSADGKRLRLAVEVCRISFAHLFDPYTGIHSSLIRPLPHQVTAVYEEIMSSNMEVAWNVKARDLITTPAV